MNRTLGWGTLIRDCERGCDMEYLRSFEVGGTVKTNKTTESASFECGEFDGNGNEIESVADALYCLFGWIEGMYPGNVDTAINRWSNEH